MNDRSAYLDETVSAYIDGEATPAEAAAVERDEALAARVSRLQAVRDAVATPVPALSDGRREQAIAAAIGAAIADTPSGRDVEAGDVVEAQQAPALAASEDPTSSDLRASGVVVPLRQRVRSPLAIAAAVIAVALMVGAGLLADRLGGTNSTEETATAADAAAFDRPENARSAAAGSGEHPEPAAASAVAGYGQDKEESAEAEGFLSEVTADSGEGTSQESDGAEQADPEMADDQVMSFDDSPTTEPSAASTLTGDADGRNDINKAPAPDLSDGSASPGETATIAAIDLGTVSNVGLLIDLVAESTRTSATGDETTDGPTDGRTAEPGVCAPAVADHVRRMGAEAITSFAAVLDGVEPRTLDAVSVQRDDGVSGVVYAIEPECQPQLRDLPG